MARGKPFLKGADPRRHVLTREQRQKGYRVFLARVEAGTLPSRVAAHVRSKIRRTGKGRVPECPDPGTLRLSWSADEMEF